MMILNVHHLGKFRSKNNPEETFAPTTTEELLIVSSSL